MTCENKIRKAITSTCETQPIGGIEQVVYLMNRTDILNVDYDAANVSLVTDLVLNTGALGYKLTGLKKALNCGFERVVAEDMADGFKHKIMFKGFEFDSESVENMDRMADLVAIVERKDKGVADGTFVIYGLTTGLYVTTDTVLMNDSNGTRVIEMGTMDGWLEKFSQNNFLDTDYATTKALLEALTVA